ncbi:MAG TPA: glycosyltransferase, partial [Lacibacter sp.]|nr:glycosyltransferase [Lacibacter sp.]
HRFTQKPARLEPHPLYDHFGEPVSRTEARNHLRLEQEPFIFLFFGFIRAYKGLDLLLEAMQLLQQDAQDLPPFRLLVAGEFYEDRQRYEQLLQQPGLLLHTDFIPDSAVRYYLCASDVVVQPYRHATQSGVTPLAYHFEKPMIVTQVGGLPDLVPHGKVGLVCAPDPVSLAAAMKEMLQKGTGSFLPHLRDEKKKYSWEQMTSTILELAAGLPGKT